jgi:hypothetical protein
MVVSGFSDADWAGCLDDKRLSHINWNINSKEE